MPLADPEAGGVVGEEAVEPVAGGGAVDPELAHVGDVEDAAGVAHGEVFFGDALVLHRHIQPAKGTIRAPACRWVSCSGERRRGAEFSTGERFPRRGGCQ